MNVHRLARAAAILDMPLIFTTSEEHGPDGALLPTLKEIRPDAYEYGIDRHGIIDSLADPAVDKAVSATAFGHDISLRRLEREGVDVTTTASVIAELTGTYPSTPRSCAAASTTHARSRVPAPSDRPSPTRGEAPSSSASPRRERRPS
jgi:hypothetical protein